MRTSFAVARVVLYITLAAIAAFGKAENESNQATTSGIVSFPLLPHHEVQRRRLEDGHPPLQRVERPSHSRYHVASTEMDVTDPHRHMADSQVEKAVQVAGLFQGYGTHYADLWCGSPAQRQTVIVDTGSGVTAFPCKECKDCGVPTYHIDALFDESASTTFKKLKCEECLRGSCGGSGDCEIGMSYQEGSSWTAYEALDSCYIGGFHDHPVSQDDGTPPDDLDPFHAKNFAFGMKFGCQTRITGLFITQLADGIMGMDVAQASFWWQMFAANKIPKKAFSLCFSRKDDAARTGTEAGAMSLGGYDLRMHQTPMVYSSTTDSSGFYVVHVNKIYLRPGGGGLSALSTDPTKTPVQLDISEDSINSGRVIVDSGTTDTYFSRRLQSAFSKVYHDLTGEVYDHSVKKFTPQQLAMQPTILFQLRGNTELNKAVQDRNASSPVVGLAGDLDPDNPYDVILAIPPEHYFEYDSESGGYVSRFYVDESNGGVLGANAMMGHDVYFDVDNFRIGWAESACDYTNLVTAYTDSTKNYIPNQNPEKESRMEPITKSDDEDGEPTDPSSGTDDEEEHGEDEGDDENFESEGDNRADDEPQDGEPSGSYDYNPASGGGVCTGLACQASVLAGVVLAIIYVAQRMVRRAPAGPAYDLTDSELELHSVDGSGYTNGDFADKCDGTFT